MESFPEAMGCGGGVREDGAEGDPEVSLKPGADPSAPGFLMSRRPLLPGLPC
jgi:hypothetical protein